MSDLADKEFSTRAVHAGERSRQSNFTPVASPIDPSVGFLYESMEDTDAVLGAEKEGYVYARYGSPTVSAFETAVANLEQSEAAFAFSSGMAALHISLLAAGVKAGSRVVSALDVYGATSSLLRSLFSSLGVHVTMVDAAKFEDVERTLKEYPTTVVLAETISNPLVRIADVPTLADLAHRYGAQLIIDNTFATPYLFNPGIYGADYTVHSATKYLNGHGDVTAGVVATSMENRSNLYELNKLVGSLLGPFEAWLALRGLKTLPLRVRQQCDNAQQAAEWLGNHPRIRQVHYSGLSSHTQHALAKRLFNGKGYGGVLSFEIRGATKSDIFRFMEALKVCLPATTLGDIYSLVLYPAISSHRSLTPEERSRIGISDELVRLSCGIESPNDIIADIDQALNAID
ncbi:MAG: PLP-dependent transferase [Chloroflexi bacterium]|nr:MAG: PLP-dependent transferase [Chloroflexota bacterium]